MPIDFGSPELTELVPKIAVIGVGGAGCNAVNNMINADLQGVDFIVANTDAQSLSSAETDNRIQLGVEITRGLGAGAQPNVGEAAAEESVDAIDDMLEGYHMAFITAGMGGGTGTGAAPVIAKRAREKGVLTVGVVTKPFQFEGGRRMKLADAGIAELAEHVDTLIIIPNQNLFRVSNERTTFADAFNMADDVLHSGVRGVTDLMVMPGLINLDFADVRTVMSEMGKAMMGTGEASGETRAAEAASAAIANPLLEESSLAGAKGVIINVTGGMDMTLFEVDEAVNMVREQVDPEALIVFGSAFSDDLEGKIRVSVVATGISNGDAGATIRPEPRPVRTEPKAPTVETGSSAGPVAAEATVAEPAGEAPTASSPIQATTEDSVDTAVPPAPETAATPPQDTSSLMRAPEASAPEAYGAESKGEPAPQEAVKPEAPKPVDEEAAALARMEQKPFMAEPAMHPKAARTNFKPGVALRAVPPAEPGNANTVDDEQPAPSATVHSHPSAARAPEPPQPRGAQQPTTAPSPAPRKKESLFSKMTAGLRAAPAREVQAPVAPQQAPAAASVAPETATEPTNAPQVSEAVPSQPTGTPSEVPAEPATEAVAKADTAQLEIPSFLRRQQN